MADFSSSAPPLSFADRQHGTHVAFPFVRLSGCKTAIYTVPVDKNEGKFLGVRNVGAVHAAVAVCIRQSCLVLSIAEVRTYMHSGNVNQEVWTKCVMHTFIP